MIMANRPENGKPTLSVIFPTFNEEANVAASVEERPSWPTSWRRNTPR